MMTKVLPFNSPGAQELYQKINHDEPNYSIIADDKLVDLLKQIFEKDPEKRCKV
jgi:hypothetical protein